LLPTTSASAALGVTGLNRAGFALRFTFFAGAFLIAFLVAFFATFFTAFLATAFFTTFFVSFLVF